MKHMFIALALMVTVSIFVTGCATTAVSEQVLNASVVGANGYKEFVPVDPIESPKVTYYDNTGKSVTKAWAQLNNKQIRDILPNIYTDISVAKRDASGGLTYLVAKATSEAGDYRVVMDYTKYRPEVVVDEKSKKEIGLGRVGVGLRMTADIHTTKSNIDLGSLFAIGFAASLNKLSGNLSVQILGIGTPDVDSLTQTNAKIDETSIQKTLESMAAIKSKIADANTTLTPQVLWVKPMAANVTPTDLKNRTRQQNL